MRSDFALARGARSPARGGELSRSSWQAAAALFSRVPWRWLAPFGAALGWVVGTVLRIRRAHVHSAMRTAGIANPSRQAASMYRALGRSAMEFMWLAARRAETSCHASVDAASRPLWDGALAKGRGIVIAASHTGNWDLAACAMAREVELLVITKHLHRASLDAFWQGTRRRKGVSLAPPRGALAAARRVLARGGAVAMMIDQVPESTRHALRVDFLGQSAFVDRAPAMLAARTGSLLVVAVSRRIGDGEHILSVLDVLTPPIHTERAWIDLATQSATQTLENFIRAYPSQWLWLHRRWKRPPDLPSGVDPAERASTLASACEPPLLSKTASSSRAGASTAGSLSAPANTRT